MDFRGVAQTLTDALERVLIMDIGGGSVEFVVAERTDAGTWQSKAALSLDAGVARLEEFGKPTDPLEEAGEERYRAFLDNVMEPLEAVLAEHQPTALVGSSGSFDTFAEAVNGSHADVPYLQRRDLEPIDRQALQRLHRRLLTEPHEQRLKIPGMAPARAKMIPLSSMLLMHVLGNDPHGDRLPIAICHARRLDGGSLATSLHRFKRSNELTMKKSPKILIIDDEAPISSELEGNPRVRELPGRGSGGRCGRPQAGDQVCL